MSRFQHAHLLILVNQHFLIRFHHAAEILCLYKCLIIFFYFLEICRKHTPAYDTLFAFYHSLASTLAGKADLGVRLKKAYDAHDLSTLETICEEVIPGIINDLSTTRLLREHLWMQDAKPFGYELVDIKLSGVIARLTSTRLRLRYYIDGRVKRLEELEADRLPYFLPGTPKRENLWHRIISGADLMDTI